MFMAGRDVANGAAGQPAIKFDRVHAGDPEDDLDPAPCQPRNQGHSNGVHA